jgi:hypothetical protein
MLAGWQDLAKDAVAYLLRIAIATERLADAAEYRAPRDTEHTAANGEEATTHATRS